jgi:hypothetical protein
MEYVVVDEVNIIPSGSYQCSVISTLHKAQIELRYIYVTKYIGMTNNFVFF